VHVQQLEEVRAEGGDDLDPGHLLGELDDAAHEEAVPDGLGREDVDPGLPQTGVRGQRQVDVVEFLAHLQKGGHVKKEALG
jgi:hypothetical protein